ncbi:MAG: hypothetical protein OSJ61_01700 [Lachnospiraceae bacterium]|nr:hypothetical protein [Lachnospiraceae bacterium]
MAFFRKITVNGKTFEWRFSVDNYDWQLPSHLVFRAPERKLKIILYFIPDDNGKSVQIGKCPFQTGLRAFREGEVVLINLNQPRFVAELLQYLLEVRIKPEETGIVTFSDGKEILRGLGYMFQYFLTEV